MNRPENEIDDAALDAMLADLATDVPELSDDLMARVLADAEAHRPVPGARIAGPQTSVLVTLLNVLGGWKGAGGLVTAGIVGLWIGISPPETLDTATAGVWDLVSPDLTQSWLSFEDIL